MFSLTIMIRSVFTHSADGLQSADSEPGTVPGIVGKRWETESNIGSTDIKKVFGVFS